eukprot:ANDGO_01913.mRNA.1 hypothetical protein
MSETAAAVRQRRQSVDFLINSNLDGPLHPGPTNLLPHLSISTTPTSHYAPAESPRNVRASPIVDIQGPRSIHVQNVHRTSLPGVPMTLTSGYVHPSPPVTSHPMHLHGVRSSPSMGFPNNSYGMNLMVTEDQYPGMAYRRSSAPADVSNLNMPGFANYQYSHGSPLQHLVVHSQGPQIPPPSYMPVVSPHARYSTGPVTQYVPVSSNDPSFGNNGVGTGTPFMSRKRDSVTSSLGNLNMAEFPSGAPVILPPPTAPSTVANVSSPVASKEVPVNPDGKRRRSVPSIPLQFTSHHIVVQSDAQGTSQNQVTDIISAKLSSAAPLHHDLYPADANHQVVMSQSQLAVEFGLISNEKKLQQFRYRDFKRAVMDRASEQHRAFIGLHPEHNLFTSRLPHKMSKRHFAYRIALVIFHSILASGAVPSCWKRLKKSVFYGNLPEFANEILPEVALLAYSRMHYEGMTLASAISYAQSQPVRPQLSSVLETSPYVSSDSENDNQGDADQEDDEEEEPVSSS